MEIDLLRAGQPMPLIDPPPPNDYRILICRPGRAEKCRSSMRSRGGLRSRRSRSRCLPEDAEPTLDLNAILHALIRAGGLRPGRSITANRPGRACDRTTRRGPRAILAQAADQTPETPAGRRDHAMNCQDHLYRHADPRRSPGAGSSSNAASGSGPWRWAICCDSGLCGRRRRTPRPSIRMAPRAPHFAPKAKRVMFLFMAGAPSHLELFDNKPQLAKFDGTLPPRRADQGLPRGVHQPELQAARAQVQVRPARPVRHRALRAAAAPRRRSSTTSRSSSGWSPTRSTTRPARS